MGFVCVGVRLRLRLRVRVTRRVAGAGGANRRIASTAGTGLRDRSLAQEKVGADAKVDIIVHDDRSLLALQVLAGSTSALLTLCRSRQAPSLLSPVSR